MTSYQYDDANRLVEVNSITYTWDDNGNASTGSARRLLNDGVNTYTYDSANRLTSISGGQSATYGYNGLGDRLTQHVDVLWFNQDDISNLIATNASGVAFTMDLARDNLIAFDVRSGPIVTIWITEIPFEKGDARGLLVDEHTVFVVTGVGVDAYKATTGELKWSTRLGDGHVSIVSQFDSEKVIVYYGDKLYEIDSETGKILTTFPKDNVIWVSNDVVLQETPNYELIAIHKQTDELLWTNDRGPYVREDYKPREIGADKLVVGFVRGICVLNLQTGEYDWCRPEIAMTNLAIDYQSQLGFAMRDDLVLLTIDLQTGNTLGETSFLSSEPIDEQIGFLSSITFSKGVVIVSFSDSGQTFGLEFKDLIK